MSLLRVDATIQGVRSASSALADLVVRPVSAVKPQITVVRRHLGEDPLPSTVSATASSSSGSVSSIARGWHSARDSLDYPVR